MLGSWTPDAPRGRSRRSAGAARRNLPRAAALLACGLLLACDPGALGLGNGRLRIRELPASEVQALVDAGRGEIVQLRHVDESLPGIRGARRLTADAPLPEDLSRSDGWIVVVAEDRALGLHLAARLARGGAPHVALAVGERAELLALAGFPVAGAAPGRGVGDAPKPESPPRHPSH